jgi:hypothetical protein
VVILEKMSVWSVLMSDEQQPDSHLEDLELRESATDWIEAGSAAIGAGAAVGGLAWNIRSGRRREAQEQATFDLLLDRGGDDGRLDLDTDYDPGFSEPIDFRVDSTDYWE